MKITFGQWLPRHSIIHNFDPRLKFLSYLFLLVMIFSWQNHFFLYFFFFTFFLLLFRVSKIPLKHIFSIFPSIFFVFIFLFFFSIIKINPKEVENDKIIKFYGHDDVILTWNFIVFSWSGIITTLFFTTRVFLVIFLTLILTSTTSPYEITFALTSLLSPLRLIGLPVAIFATIISLTLRLVPTLINEANIIIEAQASRGLDFQNSSIRKKISISIALIIPLLVSIFNRSDEMANTLEARGYDPSNQNYSYFQQFVYRKIDWLMFLFVIVLMSAIIITTRNLPTENWITFNFFDFLKNKINAHHH